MKENLNKIPYVPPTLEVMEYLVEKGFANTTVHSNSLDTWSQINDDYNHHQHHNNGHHYGWENNKNWYRDHDAGENYHGEWY